MDINHISVSRKGTWNECQVKYKFKYHEKIIPPGEEPFYFLFGKVLHKVAEIFLKSSGATPVSEASRMVLNEEVELEPGKYSPRLNEWPRAYKTRLPIHLRSLEQMTEKMGFAGEHYIEHPFYYDLDGTGKHAKGFIDRVTFLNGKVFLVDYKTTKPGPYRETAASVSTSLQLRLYARVIQKEFNVKAEDINCAFFYLEDRQIVGASYTAESLILAEKQLLEAYKQIESTPPEKAFARVGEHCKRCEFNTLCPFYNGK